MRILVVEDEKGMANFIERGLNEERYAVDVSYEAESAAFLIQNNSYDLIVMDIMLPDKNGIQLCEEVRSRHNTPIMLLTAKNTLSDKAMGFNAGADDYLSKPFQFEEFLMRVRALLRRRVSENKPILQVSDLVLNQSTLTVKRADKDINLTAKEFALLRYLMLNANQIVTRTMISEHVWNDNFDTFTNVIDVYVNYLRNKIDKGFDDKLIHTVRYTGYTLKATT